MTNHCFISYSGADGLDFATRLADELQGQHPFFKVWFDKRELSSSSPDDWDDQLANAIKACKCLIFVMTEDSTADGSVCKDEWTWALKYKKPVITIRKDTKAEVPFRLNNKQHVDFVTSFDVGIAQLRTALARLDSPDGALDEFRSRLADANRDLRRAKSEDQARIKAEIEDLRKQIEVQEKIVANPQAAQEQIRKNIEAGLERERQPVKPTAVQTSTKFINPPPGIAPNYFQDRTLETKQVFDFLNDDSQRLMTIVGRGGVGKTAMVCRLLKGIESGQLPDGLGEMKVDGIVYLSETGSHRINFANIFYDLCKLLLTETAQDLDAIYKNSQGSTESKMRALLEKFSSGRVVLLLDNFEQLVNTETLAIRDTELDEALRSFLGGTHTCVKIIITTREEPRTLNLLQPGRQRVYPIDEGLEPQYAEKMLREMDTDGRLGLKNVDEKLLQRSYERTRGFPKALEALFAILASDRYTTLEELLAMTTPENVVEALVGEAFNRLDTNAQKVMQALAIYNRPVAPAAVDYLLTPHLPAMDSAPILQRLANMHFARKESGKFYLHPVDREFAYNLIPEGEKTLQEIEEPDFNSAGIKNEEQDKNMAKVLGNENVQKTSDKETSEIDFEELFKNYKYKQSRTDFTHYGLLDRAADYFAQARKPRAEWKKLEDLSAQLAEFDLRCAAGDFDTAASVLLEIDFDYLFLWGHYRLSIDLHVRIKDKITDETLRMGNLNGLGSSHRSIGELRESIVFWQQGLDIAFEAKNRYAEAIFLGNLGNAYSGLGDEHKAIEYYEQALVIDREIGNRKGEGVGLNNLGSAYKYLGNTQKAIEYQEEALKIAQELGDRKDESSYLINLGNRYSELADFNKAVEYYEKSILIKQEIGDQSGESIGRENNGDALLGLGDYRRACENYQKAVQFADEISFLQTQNYARLGLAQAYLLQNDLVNARTTIKAALQYDVPENNHNVSALHGIITLRQGDEVTARQAFTRAIAQVDEILAKTPEYHDALDAKGLASCGLAICEDKKYIRDAIETFHMARKIAPYAGIVKRNLRLFDELVKCDEEEILKGVRQAVEGVE